MKTQRHLEAAARAAACEKLIEASRLHPRETLKGVVAKQELLRLLDPSDVIEIVKNLIEALGSACLDVLAPVLGSIPAANRQVANLRFASAR